MCSHKLPSSARTEGTTPTRPSLASLAGWNAVTLSDVAIIGYHILNSELYYIISGPLGWQRLLPYFRGNWDGDGD